MRTFTPLVGAELILEPGSTTTLAIDTGFEHGLLVDHGDVRIAGTILRPAELGCLGTGSDTLTLANETDTAARVVLLGGTPFEEQIVMWWNFIGRSDDDIVEAREAWQSASDRFGKVDGYDGDRLPAPVLPNATIAPRKNLTRQRRHTMTQPAAAPAVQPVDPKHRYEILVDGKTAVLTA